VQSLSLHQNKLLGTFLDLLFQKIDRIQDLNSKKNCTTSSEEHVQIAHVRHASNIQRQTQRVKIDVPSLPPIPTAYGKIHLVILEGSKSFIPMLAHPTIRTLGNHANVLPSQCIRHFLATGNLPMLFDNTTACDV
jgi:hypothetical protein